eukprot:8670986-Pyramimonas_sp.AAC.1
MYSSPPQQTNPPEHAPTHSGVERGGRVADKTRSVGHSLVSRSSLVVWRKCARYASVRWAVCSARVFQGTPA